MTGPKRIIVVDPVASSREALVRRLSSQGYLVEEAADPARGADMALSSPPSAVVADLWMPSISGVQLCRLLKSEPGTAEVPVVLRGERNDPRSRFWAERAGAAAYVQRGRVGDLSRALSAALARERPEDGFFMQLSGGSTDVRERIAQHLDAALFESVIASEVRALATSATLGELFDRFSQFLSQVHSYRWLALSTAGPPRFSLHHHPRQAEAAEKEARLTLSVPKPVAAQRLEDEDAEDHGDGPAPLVREVSFGGIGIGRLAMASKEASDEAEQLLDLVARELGGAIRMSALVEESQRLATVDPLTGMMNRRAFSASSGAEIARARRHPQPVSVLLLDIDHFKVVNDQRGHASGDRVLSAVGALLPASLRQSDLAARWGGEEFVVLLPNTPLQGALVSAERVRAAIEALRVDDDDGRPIPVTASIGASELASDDTFGLLIDRADRAMYEAKHAGRNQVRSLAASLAGIRTHATAIGPASDPAPGASVRAMAQGALVTAQPE